MFRISSSNGQEPADSTTDGHGEDVGLHNALAKETMSGSSLVHPLVLDGLAVDHRSCTEPAHEGRTSKPHLSLARGPTFETPNQSNASGDGCATAVSDCSTADPEACPHALESSAANLFREPEAASDDSTQAKDDPDGNIAIIGDPDPAMGPRAVLLLSKISVTRDELLELLKFVPIDILMAEPTEAPPGAAHCPLCPIDSACDKCPLPLLEEYCRVFLLRISRFYLVLLSTTIAIRVVVATEAEGSREGTKCYTVALCRGIVGGNPYQLDGSWIGLRKRPGSDTGHSESHVSIGMTMRLFAESLGKTCVKVPLHGVSNRAVWEPDLEAAFNDLSKVGASENEPSQQLDEVVTRTVADLEGRALALQYLRRFAICLEALFYTLPLLRGTATQASTIEADASMSSGLNACVDIQYDDDDDDDFAEVSEEQRIHSLFGNHALIDQDPQTVSNERALRNQVRCLLKEMQTRLFEAAFISKQKSVEDIATVERSLKKVIHCIGANNRSLGLGEAPSTNSSS